GLQFGKVLRPKRVLILAQLVQIVPRINAGAVPVGEYRLNRVRADRLEHANLDLAFAGLEHLLPRPVAAHLCRRAVHAQEFVRHVKAAGTHDEVRRQTETQQHPGRDIAVPGTHQPADLAEHEVLRLARAHGDQLTVAEAPARTGAAPHHAQALRALVLELPLLEDEARRIFPLSLLAPADPAERLHLLALFWRQLASLARVAEPLSREGVMK